jgi:hypothetical protein
LHLLRQSGRSFVSRAEAEAEALYALVPSAWRVQSPPRQPKERDDGMILVEVVRSIQVDALVAARRLARDLEQVTVHLHSQRFVIHDVFHLLDVIDGDGHRHRWS